MFEEYEELIIFTLLGRPSSLGLADIEREILGISDANHAARIPIVATDKTNLQSAGGGGAVLHCTVTSKHGLPGLYHVFDINIIDI